MLTPARFAVRAAGGSYVSYCWTSIDIVVDERPRFRAGERAVASDRKWFIRNIAAVPWRQFPDHFV